MSIKLVMPSNHLFLYCPLLLLPSIFPSIRVSSNESALHIRWPEYWSFSFSIIPSKEHPGLISFVLILKLPWIWPVRAPQGASCVLLTYPVLFFKLKYILSLFIWPCCRACEILVPQPRIKPLALKVQSLNHWTTREFPWPAFLF